MESGKIVYNEGYTHIIILWWFRKSALILVQTPFWKYIAHVWYMLLHMHLQEVYIWSDIFASSI